MPTPEEKARQKIDDQLAQCGWIVQDAANMNISAGLNEGGLIYESEDSRTLAEAMAALEKGLEEWFRENN